MCRWEEEENRKRRRGRERERVTAGLGESHRKLETE